MNDAFIILWLVLFGIILLIVGALVQHNTEEIPRHKWDDMMEDFNKTREKK